MGQGAHVGSPTADGGAVLTGARTVFFENKPATGKGHVTVSPQKGIGAVKNGSSSVFVEGVNASAAHDHKTLAPSPSHAGAGAHPVLDAATLREAIAKGIDAIQKKQARHVEITNGDEGKTREELLEENHGAVKTYDLTIDDFNGDGVVDSIKFEGSAASVQGQLVKQVGQGGFGIEGSIDLGKLEVGGYMNPTAAAAKIEGQLLSARVGLIAQDPLNQFNYVKAGIGLDVGSAEAQAGIGLTEGSASAEASFLSAPLDASISRSVLDLVVPGASAIDAVTGGLVTKTKDTLVNGLAGVVGRYKPEWGQQIKEWKDATVQVDAELTPKVGALGAGEEHSFGYNSQTKRIEVAGEGELELEVGADLKIKISIGVPGKSPIKPKGKEEAPIPIIGGALKIVVGDNKHFESKREKPVEGVDHHAKKVEEPKMAPSHLQPMNPVPVHTPIAPMIPVPSHVMNPLPFPLK